MPLWCKVEVNDKDNGHLSNLTKNCRETGKTLQLQVLEHWVERLLFGRSGQILWTWGSIYTCYIFEMFLETLPSSVHAGSSIKHVFPSINDTKHHASNKALWNQIWSTLSMYNMGYCHHCLENLWYRRAIADGIQNAVSKIASGWLRIWNTQGISLCWDLVLRVKNTLCKPFPSQKSHHIHPSFIHTFTIDRFPYFFYPPKWHLAQTCWCHPPGI